MSKTVKTISMLVVILIAIIGIATWLLVSNLDSLVKRVVEDVGSDTLGTKVSLSSATVSISDASAVLRGLEIANPDGFEAGNAFELGAIEVSIDPASLSTDTLVLSAIIIDQAKLTFEQQGSQNNLQTLMDNLNSGSGESSDSAGADNEDETLLAIGEFRLNEAGMTLSHDRLEEKISFTLPDIVLHDIGRIDAGVTAEQAARQIITPVIQRSKDAAQDRAKQELEAAARKELDKQTDKALDSMQKKLFGK
jgi:uncharacterized protein involved in outer membrane biogenesis